MKLSVRKSKQAKYRETNSSHSEVIDSRDIDFYYPREEIKGKQKIKRNQTAKEQVPKVESGEAIEGVEETERRLEESGRIRTGKELWEIARKKVLSRKKAINQFIQINKDVKAFGAIVTSTQIFDEAEEKEINIHCCIILPDSISKLVWNCIMILLLFITMGYVPYRIAFIEYPSLELIIFECIMDVFFLADIIIQFMSAYYDDKSNLITDPKTIAFNYIRSWFLLDCIACFPFQLFELNQRGGSTPEYNKLARLFRLGRLYHLMKILLLFKLYRFMKDSKFFERIIVTLHMNGGIFRIINTIFMMLFLAHFFACSLFYINRLHNFSPDTWAVRNALLDSAKGTQYLACFYFVLQTLTTVGYGDLVLYKDDERLLACCIMVFGVGFYSYTIGNLSSILSNIDSKTRKLKVKQLALEEYAKQVNMPIAMYRKIQKVLEKNHHRDFKTFDPDALLSELPNALRGEVVTLAHQKILDTIPFFHTKSPDFICRATSYLKHIILENGEALYMDGDSPEHIYFILKGKVKVLTSDGYVYKSYGNGAYFGEIEVFTYQEARNHSALAETECELLYINGNNFIELLEDFSEVKKEMRSRIEDKIKNHEEAIKKAKMRHLRIDSITRDRIFGNNRKLSLLKQNTILQYEGRDSTERRKSRPEGGFQYNIFQSALTNKFENLEKSRQRSMWYTKKEDSGINVQRTTQQENNFGKKMGCKKCSSNSNSNSESESEYSRENSNKQQMDSERTPRLFTHSPEKGSSNTSFSLLEIPEEEKKSIEQGELKISGDNKFEFLQRGKTKRELPNAFVSMKDIAAGICDQGFDHYEEDNAHSSDTTSRIPPEFPSPNPSFSQHSFCENPSTEREISSISKHSSEVRPSSPPSIPIIPENKYSGNLERFERNLLSILGNQFSNLMNENGAQWDQLSGYFDLSLDILKEMNKNLKGLIRKIRQIDNKMHEKLKHQSEQGLTW